MKNQQNQQTPQPPYQQIFAFLGKRKSAGIAFLLAFLFGPLGLLCGIGETRLYAQQEQELNTEQAFFIFMKIYDLNPYTPTIEPRFTMEVKRWGKNFLEYYVIEFDSYNYQQKRNDEFERSKYLATMEKKLSDGIASARFDKKYIKWANATIGEYSFTNNSFPILFEPRDYLIILILDRLWAQGVIDNYTDFGFSSPKDARGAMSLAMPEVEARAFLASRRAANGSVNRAISLKFTYSVLNKRGQPGNVAMRSFGAGGFGRDMLLFVHSIDIYGYEGGKKLGTIYPTKSFDEYMGKVSETSRSQISTSHPPDNLPVNYFGTFNGISEYQGSTLIIKSDSTVEWIQAGTSYRGTLLSLTKMNDEKDSSIKNKIKRKLNRDVETTGYSMAFEFNVNGKVDDAHLILVKDGSNLILWGGGDLFFEKRVENNF